MGLDYLSAGLWRCIGMHTCRVVRGYYLRSDRSKREPSFPTTVEMTSLELLAGITPTRIIAAQVLAIRVLTHKLFEANQGSLSAFVVSRAAVRLAWSIARGDRPSGNHLRKKTKELTHCVVREACPAAAARWHFFQAARSRGRTSRSIRAASLSIVLSKS